MQEEKKWIMRTVDLCPYVCIEGRTGILPVVMYESGQKRKCISLFNGLKVYTASLGFSCIYKALVVFPRN
jgi:hypothetical protein